MRVVCPNCGHAIAPDHPLRLAVLGAMADGPPEGLPGWSPKALSDELDAPLGTVAYHVRVLASTGQLREAGRRQRRGAVEHFYEVVRP